MRQIMAFYMDKDSMFNLVAANEMLMEYDGKRRKVYEIKAILNEVPYTTTEQLFLEEGWEAFCNMPPWMDEIIFIKHVITTNDAVNR